MMKKLDWIATNERLEIFRVLGENLPSQSFVISSEPSRKILTQQWLAGLELQNLAIKAGEVFLHASHEYGPLKGLASSDISELVLMCGGLYYGIGRAYSNVFGQAAQQCFIGIKRFKNDDGSWRADIGYSNFEALPKNATVIVGDTIATGSSLKRALVALKDEALKQGSKIERVVVFTLAGGINGVTLLSEIEKEFAKTWPGFKLWLYAAEGIFGVMPNGTDMPFSHPKTVLSPAMHAALDGKNVQREKMACCIFDWGHRVKNPMKHYREFIEFCEGLLKDEEDPASISEISGWRYAAELEMDRYVERIGIRADEQASVKA